MTTLTELCDHAHDLLETNKTDLGLEAVFYGDQRRYPVTPSAAVEPGRKRTDMHGVPRRVERSFEFFVLLYHSKVQDQQLNRMEVDALGEAIETFLNQDVTFGGLLIGGMVTNYESGYAFRSGTLFSSVRMTYEGRQYANLPMAEGYNQ